MYQEEFIVRKRFYKTDNSKLFFYNWRLYQSFARYNIETHKATIHAQHFSDKSFSQIIKMILHSGLHEFLHHFEIIDSLEFEEGIIDNLCKGKQILLEVFMIDINANRTKN